MCLSVCLLVCLCYPSPSFNTINSIGCSLCLLFNVLVWLFVYFVHVFILDTIMAEMNMILGFAFTSVP